MTPEEEKRAKAAADKRAYRLRKKQEDLARQAPKEEQERLFNEQFRNLSPEEIEARNREEKARMQDLRRIAEATPNPLSKEQKEQAVQQILAAHPELEEQFRKAQCNSTIRPVYKDSHKDELADMLAASEERGRRTKLIMSMYERDAANMPKLLWHILETLTRMRLEMVDLIGGLRNGK